MDKKQQIRTLGDSTGGAISIPLNGVVGGHLNGKLASALSLVESPSVRIYEDFILVLKGAVEV